MKKDWGKELEKKTPLFKDTRKELVKIYLV